MAPRPRSLESSLRAAIKADGRTHYALAKAAEVAPAQLDRFMLPAADPRRRSLSLESASRIASALHLELR